MLDSIATFEFPDVSDIHECHDLGQQALNGDFHIRTITQLVWDHFDIPDRLEILKDLRANLAFVRTQSVLIIMGDRTLKALAGFQRSVNSARIWYGPGSVGAAIDHMIDRGFLLHAPEAQKDYYGQTIASRTQRSAGSPGTMAFVESQMGAAYASWIDKIR